ncbi:MAG: ABC transporter permease subunit [Candidatus Latescibacteria bacterium]|nr:ABC transporter permease subunit [Candidatus Latescibacterota bacterium]
MALVSIALFALLEAGAGDITQKLLGAFATPQQRASYRAQLGLDQPLWRRYTTWLVGNDWWLETRLGIPLLQQTNPQSGEEEWWALVEGQPTRWKMDGGKLLARHPGTPYQTADQMWRNDAKGEQFFWGLDESNRAVKWIRSAGAETWVLTPAGFRKQGDGPRTYIPLQKGLLRGDPGQSLRTGRPVSSTLFPRLRNTAILAGLAFALIVPLALLLGVLAGVKAGRPTDRIISLASLVATATPEFVTGILLILVFGIWLKLLPAVSLFLEKDALFADPSLLILPVLTLTAVELGYIIRITRTSLIEVMGRPYIRTALLKGLPIGRVVLRHALRNALIAPITVIMLHTNWLIGGLVVVEAVFGYPGLGLYIYDSALFGDFNAVEAAAMLLVSIAVGTRLLGDLAYTYLNPRIRLD